MYYEEGFTAAEALKDYKITLDVDHSFINCYPVQMAPLVEVCAVYLIHDNIFMKLSVGIYEHDGFTFRNFHDLLLRADEKLKLAFP